MKMTALPRRRQLVVIANLCRCGFGGVDEDDSTFTTSSTYCDRHSSIRLMLADKTHGGDVDDVGCRLTGSTAGCRSAASMYCVRYSFPSKQIRVDLDKSRCSKQIR